MSANRIVIDNGSCTIKVGFAGADLPVALVPTVIGRPKHVIETIPMKEAYFDEEARKLRGILRRRYPIGRYADFHSDHSTVCWNDIEAIWDYTFKEKLKVDPKLYSFMLADFTINHEKNSEKAVELMFEKYEVPTVSIVHPALLSLFATGHKTGVVVDSGHDCTRIHCVHDGRVLNEGTILMRAGIDLTDYLGHLIEKRDLFPSIHDLDQRIKEIKEEICYVSNDFHGELSCPENPNLSRTLEMFAGEEAIFKTERFECPEILFMEKVSKLRYFNSISTPLHLAMVSSIQSCDANVHAELFSNIVLAGGTSLLQGLQNRLQADISALVPDTNINIRCSGQPLQQFLAWHGGSKLALKENIWMQKSEWEESGSQMLAKLEDNIRNIMLDV